MEKYPYMFSRQQYFKRDITTKNLKTKLYRLLAILASIFTLYFLVYQKLAAAPILEITIAMLLFTLLILFWHPSSGFARRGSAGEFSARRNTKFRFYMASSGKTQPLLKKGDVVLVQNMAESSVMAVWGVTLRSTAIQIQPNVSDFLRRMYEIPAFVPINVQMTITANPARFSYTLFFGRMLGASNNKPSKLLTKVDELGQDLITALEINFPHFHFARLEGAELIRGMTGGITGVTDMVVQRNTSSFFPLVMRAVSRLFMWVIGNFGIWFGLGLAVKDCTPWIHLASLIFLLGGMGAVIWNARKLYFFRGMTDQEILPVSVFPQSQFLRSSGQKKIHIYNQGYQQLLVNKMYTLGTLNRHFRFNSTKFYRALLSQVTTNDVGVTLNFYLRRLVEETMPRFEAMFSQKFWRQWDNLPDRRAGIARDVCGFYRFQVLLTTFKTVNKHLRDIIQQDVDEAQYELDKAFFPVFRQGFSHCEPREVDDRNLWQFLGKATDIFSTGHLPIFLSTGIQLTPFISVPDEIHKILPLIYPSEFATPIINDDYEFGSTLNSENHQLESACGLKTQEIAENILVGGDHRTDVQNALQQVVFALMDENIPTVIFDWDGTWSSPLGRFLDENPTQSIEYYELGKDLGISLFALPPSNIQVVTSESKVAPKDDQGQKKAAVSPSSIPGSVEVAYINDIVRTFRLIYKWNDAEIALLQNILGNASGPDILQILVDIDALDKQAYKSAFKALVVVLGKDFLKTVFDTKLSSQFIIQTWHNRNTSLIINMQALKDPQLKHLFVRLFLTQLLYTKEYFELPDELLFPKCVVLPVLHNLWDERSGKGNLDSTFPFMTRLIEDHHPLLASTHMIERVNPGIFGMFKTTFALRVQSPKSLKIMEDILHLDDFYTNSSSSHGSNRHRSYQKRFLLHMEPHQSLVVRPTQSFPYIFQFYHNGTSKPYSFSDLLVEKHLFTPEMDAKNSPSTDSNASPVELDFKGRDKLISVLYNFFSGVKDKHTLCESISRAQLMEDLFALMGPVFQDSIWTPPEKQKQCESILDKLIKKQYLQAKVVGMGTATQQTGYELGKNAKDSLEKHRLNLEKENIEKSQKAAQKARAEAERLANQDIEKFIEGGQRLEGDEEDENGTFVAYPFPEPQIPEESESPIQDHPTASQEFIDGVSSLVTRLTMMFVFGMSRWENEGIAASYHQLDQDLTNVEEHLAPFTDQYSKDILEALMEFHTKLMATPPGDLTDAQYGALMEEYEVIPKRIW